MAFADATGTPGAVTFTIDRVASFEDVGNAAVFAASDWAATLTCATVNISCGAIPDF